MLTKERALRLDAALVRELLERHPDVAWPGASLRAVRLAEIVGSLNFFGTPLRRREIESLVATGLTPPAQSLEAVNAVADYAAAAAHVAALGRPRRRQPLLRVEEIVALHALATRRSSVERPGKWRAATAETQSSGAVPPPAWLVPRDVTALVERFSSGPPPERPFTLWLADFHARLRRIHPFATANGRVARLSVNLMLTRLRCPPLVIGRAEEGLFARSLDRAAASDLWPSALFFGRSLTKSLRDLRSELAAPAEALVLLRTIAGLEERAALYKAAQRGRLRTVREGTAVLTSQIWLDDYRRSRAAAGRPPTIRPH